MFPGYLIASLIGMTRGCWVLVTKREVVVTRFRRSDRRALRGDVLRLERPVHFELANQRGYVSKVTLPAEVAEFVGKRRLVAEGKRSRQALELAGTPPVEEAAAASTGTVSIRAFAAAGRR